MADTCMIIVENKMFISRTDLKMRPSEVLDLRGASHQYSCDILELAQKDVCVCVALRIKDEYVVVIPEETVYIVYLHPLGDLYVLDTADKMPTRARYRIQ